MNTEQNQWVGTDANYIISTHAIDLADWYKKATGAKRVNFLTHGQVKLERHRQRAIVSKSQNPRVSWLFTVTDWSNSKETGLGTLRPHSLPSFSWGCANYPLHRPTIQCQPQKRILQRVKAVSRLWILSEETISDIPPQYLIHALLDMQWNAGLCLLIEDACTALDRDPGSHWEGHKKVEPDNWFHGPGHLVLGHYWQIAKKLPTC